MLDHPGDAAMLQAPGDEDLDVGLRMAPLGGWRGRAWVGNGDSAAARTGVAGDAGGRSRSSRFGPARHCPATSARQCR